MIYIHLWLSKRRWCLSLAASHSFSRAAARDLRRLRILASLQAGLSYAAIGRVEGLSRERVRQIVAQALAQGQADSKVDHARVQIARLEPALRLAAGAVAESDLGAIDRLLGCSTASTATAPSKAPRRASTRLARKAARQAQRDGRAHDRGAPVGSGRRRRPALSARRRSRP